MKLSVGWQDLSFRWRKDKALLDGLSDIRDFESLNYVLPLIGRTGRGKSSLLFLLGGMMPPLAGSITWTWSGQGGDSRWSATCFQTAHASRRQRFGFLLQDATLLPCFTVEENIRYSLRLRGVSEWIETADGRRVNRITETIKSMLIKGEELGPSTAERAGKFGPWGRTGAVRKTEPMLAKFPNELSGGQRQRMALAVAIAHDPTVLFTDEPTASLDDQTGDEVLGKIREWLDSTRGMRGLVIVTHRTECLSDALKAKRALDLNGRAPVEVSLPLSSQTPAALHQ